MISPSSECLVFSHFSLFGLIRHEETLFVGILELCCDLEFPNLLVSLGNASCSIIGMISIQFRYL